MYALAQILRVLYVLIWSGLAFSSIRDSGDPFLHPLFCRDNYIAKRFYFPCASYRDAIAWPCLFVRLDDKLMTKMTPCSYFTSSYDFQSSGCPEMLQKSIFRETNIAKRLWVNLKKSKCSLSTSSTPTRAQVGISCEIRGLLSSC